MIRQEQWYSMVRRGQSRTHAKQISMQSCKTRVEGKGWVRAMG